MPGSSYRYSATFDTTYTEELLESSGSINPTPATNGAGPLQALIEADCKRHLSHGSESSFSGSSAGSPHHARSSSVDSLDSSCGSSIARSDQGNIESIPTRRPPKTVCKPAHNPLQFVKINSKLSKEAEEQIKMVKEIKKAKEPLYEEDWQSNLENWKSRRKKSSDHLVVNRLQDLQVSPENKEDSKPMRKIKTFSEILENRPRGPLCNLAIYGEEEDSRIQTPHHPTTDDPSPQVNHNGQQQQEKSEQPATTTKEDKMADSGLDSLSSSHRTLAADSDGSLEAGCTTSTELLREFSSKPPSPIPHKSGREEDEGLELYLRVSLPSNGESQQPPPQDFGFSVLQKEDLVVDTLAPGGASEQAGLRIGDHILAVNGEDASHHEAFTSLLERAFSSGQLELLVWRHTITNNLTRQWHQNQSKILIDKATSEENLLRARKSRSHARHSAASRRRQPTLESSQSPPTREESTQPPEPAIRAPNFKEKVKSFEMLSASQEEEKRTSARKPPLVPYKPRTPSRHQAVQRETAVSRSQSLDNCYMAAEDEQLSPPQKESTRQPSTHSTQTPEPSSHSALSILKYSSLLDGTTPSASLPEQLPSSQKEDSTPPKPQPPKVTFNLADQVHYYNTHTSQEYPRGYCDQFFNSGLNVIYQSYVPHHENMASSYR